MNFNELFKGFQQLKVAVIGDVMLDTYMWGSVERISPEAPVPVVSLKKKEYRIGGASNVALNTIALGAQTFVFSVIGNDDDGTALLQLLQQSNINTDGIIKANNRITTNKIRVIARNQHMMRLDAEITHDIDAVLENELLAKIELFFTTNKPDLVIFEDYNKGVLTTTLIEKVIALCKQYNIITTVDPKRKNFFAFKGVDIFKPNLKEVKEALNVLIDTVDLKSLQQIHQQLKEVLEHHISLITLSEKGVFYHTETTANIIPTHVRSIADVSGAGDTVIAVASLVYAATNDIHLSAEIANIAGGLVCEEVGTVAINKEKLLAETKMLLQ
jgi:rfaE bifunctional protein kinase chain/domain